MYQYEMLRIRREWDRRGREVESEDRIFAQAYSEAPYVARPADSLVADGFARISASESVFWAPDAAVLFSDPFLDTHCLKVTAGGNDASGLVGLAFEPVPSYRPAGGHARRNHRGERGVLRVHGTEGVVFEGDPGRRIVGTVFDTLQVGLPGARVFLEGSGNEVVTDAQGRFELTHLQPGVYGASGPSAPVIAGNRLTWRNGILTGRVTDEAGNPVAGASVYLQANAFVVGSFVVDAANRIGGAGEMKNARLQTRERTSDSGFYRACWVPVDIPLEVLVVDKDKKIDRGALERAVSLSDSFPGRVQVITISGDAPYRTLDLRVRPGGS